MNPKGLTIRVFTRTFIVYALIMALGLSTVYFYKIIIQPILSGKVEVRYKHELEVKKSLLREKSDALSLIALKSKENEERKKAQFQKYLAYAILKLQPTLGPNMAEQIAGSIIVESKSNGLDPILVTALIWTESRFNPLAHNKLGAVGLMQVRYPVWKETSILRGNGVSAKHKLFWPDLNIKCGTEILAKYYDQAGHNIAKTLYRYNTGSKELPKDKSVSEISYVNKIMLTMYNVLDSVREGKTKLIEEFRTDK